MAANDIAERELTEEQVLARVKQGDYLTKYGFSDAEEIAAGSDPLDPDDQPFETTVLYLVAGFLVVLALSLVLAFLYKKKIPPNLKENQVVEVKEEAAVEEE